MLIGNVIGMPFGRSKVVAGLVNNNLYYANGVENIPWVNGYSLRTGTQEKRVNHLYLLTEGEQTSERTFVTDIAIDLTAIKTLYIDWENTGDNHSDNKSRLIASKNKTSSAITFDARLSVDGSFGRATDILDVSGLSGSFFIRVHASLGTNVYRKSELKVYRVWGE